MMSNNDPFIRLFVQRLLLPVKIFNENKIGKAHEYNSMSAWTGNPVQCPSSSGKRDFKQELCKKQFPLCMKDSVSYNLIMVLTNEAMPDYILVVYSDSDKIHTGVLRGGN